MCLSIPSDVSLMFNSLRLPLSRVNECQSSSELVMKERPHVGATIGSSSSSSLGMTTSLPSKIKINSRQRRENLEMIDLITIFAS